MDTVTFTEFVNMVASDLKLGHLHAEGTAHVASVECRTCGARETYSAQIVNPMTRGEAIATAASWLSRHKHSVIEPARCRNAYKGEHVFFGFDPKRRCACGYTEEEARDLVLSVDRESRQHAQMGWP